MSTDIDEDSVSTFPEERPRMKKHTFAGNFALGFYALALVLTFIAFFSSKWIVRDARIRGSESESFGLWIYCASSLPNPKYLAEQRFFVGCHWIFDPFTQGNNEVKRFLLPLHYMVTQFFYTIAFLGTLLSAAGSLMFLVYCTPKNKNFVRTIFSTGFTLVVSGVCATIAVFIFGLFADRPGIPVQNFFGWAFCVAIASSFSILASGAFYFIEGCIQAKKKRCLKQSQSSMALRINT